MTHTDFISVGFWNALWGAAHEPRVWFIFAICLIGGVVRGFSGFGGALIVLPLAAMVFGPAIAVPMFYLFDLGSATPYGYTAIPKSKWPEIWPMLLGHILILPFGAWFLVNLDPIAVRWVMEAAVVSMLILLISGWRYTGRPTRPGSFGIGIVAGFMGASSGISGPPIIAYWLGQKENAAAIRTNIMAYYALSSTAMDIYFLWKGLFTMQVVIYALLLWPAYAAGLWAGARLFRGASDRVFRISAYALIAFTAIISAPVMDKLLR